MAAANTNSLIDPKSGFCSLTKTYHSLRPQITLPPSSQPLSITQYILSLHQNSFTSTAIPNRTYLIDAETGHHLSYSEFLCQTNSLSRSLKKHYSLSQGDVAFILSPNSIHIPIIYFSLLSIGVVISPTNPEESIDMIAHHVQLTRPAIAFATSRTSHKLPSGIRTILIDSSEFLSLLTYQKNVIDNHGDVVINQSDVAAILFSSGTTGRSKGVLLTHRNFISVMAAHANNPIHQLQATEQQVVALATRSFVHIVCFTMLLRVLLLGETLIISEAICNDFEEVLKAVDTYKANLIPVSPSFIVALVKSESITSKYDLGSMKFFFCGGAPLDNVVAMKCREKFPNVLIIDGYGLTESASVAAWSKGFEEINRFDSVGCLVEFMEAKILDITTGEALPPGQKGELWLRGPNIMKGYVRDEKATTETLDSEGWLKTGDLCYFDSDGFLFVVDRLKELIKYHGCQIAPAELEALLLSNPKIFDAAVIPYPDEEAGEVPMAFVVPKPGTIITETQVIDFIAKQVAPYKKIRRVAFIDSIPKSASEKILRRDLVHRALSGYMTK